MIQKILKIPKIIHQTAPKNERKWHPVWKLCQESWLKTYPKFKYMLWSDEDLLALIKTDFPQYLEVYNKFDEDILRIDFARYAILYKYGGIYSDMDYYCKKNFYELLTNNISIVGSPAYNEKVQNSLMASPKHDKRWLDVLENCKNYYESFKRDKPNVRITGKYVIDISGPRLLSRAINLKTIVILDKNKFNPGTQKFLSEKIYTKHYGTGKWGPKAGIRNLLVRNNFLAGDKDIEDYIQNL